MSSGWPYSPTGMSSLLSFFLNSGGELRRICSEMMRPGGDFLRGLLLQELELDDEYLGFQMVLKLLKKILSGGNGGNPTTLLRKGGSNAPADTDARARDERRPPRNAEIHAGGRLPCL